MDCWLTVPAVWSDQARHATKAAAKAAGFGSRAGDTISVISEPEAAAITVLKKYAQVGSINALQIGQVVLICDCGGGTVDITTYTIVETTPRLEFEEIVVGDGKACGSTFVDRNLHALMRERFGQAFDDVEPRRKGPGSRFMNQWESVKRSFGQSGSYLTKEIGPLNMRGVFTSEWYDDEDCLVKLTYEDVEGLFQPVVADIIGLVSDQSLELQKQWRALDRVLLVGGFGDSEYLHKKLSEWCEQNGISQAECPENPQAAIVRGAALRGLEGIAPNRRRCRRHYGVKISLPFREGIDPPSKGYTSRWSGRRSCRDRVDWLISKGDLVDQDTVRKVKICIYCRRDDDRWHKTRLVSSTLEVPPQYADDPRVDSVGTVTTDFRETNPSDFQSHREGLFGKKLWKLDFQLQVGFGSQAGVLDFKTFIKHELSGTASITFD
ncbi:hypothetical protein LTR85_006467 [Meristemomyces frigidus]|nr:hypothetical protein LTR85_006467 [Meristemomyces frigidus]